jgi:hypothetical protein
MCEILSKLKELDEGMQEIRKFRQHARSSPVDSSPERPRLSAALSDHMTASQRSRSSAGAQEAESPQHDADAANESLLLSPGDADAANESLLLSPGRWDDFLQQLAQMSQAREGADTTGIDANDLTLKMRSALRSLDPDAVDAFQSHVRAMHREPEDVAQAGEDLQFLSTAGAIRASIAPPPTSWGSVITSRASSKSEEE